MGKQLQKKKELLKALMNRYVVLEWDGGYNLYDTTKPKKLTNNGEFVAQIYLSTGYDAYVFNHDRYKTVTELEEAIESHIVTLPFYHGNYCPTYKKSCFMEMCIRDYMERIGYELSNDWRNNSRGDKFIKKGLWGEIISEWLIEVDCDSTKGKIFKYLEDYSWTENTFDGLDEAIGAINTMVSAEALVKGGAMTNVLSCITNDRYGSMTNVKIDGLNVIVEDQKYKLIEKLEQELKILKGE